MQKLKESDVQKAIIDELKMRGIVCFRNQTTGIYSQKENRYIPYNVQKGVSDIIGVLPDGTFFAIEVKRPGNNEVSESQQDFIDKVNASNGIAFVAHTMEEVYAGLKPKWG